MNQLTVASILSGFTYLRKNNRVFVDLRIRILELDRKN